MILPIVFLLVILALSSLEFLYFLVSSKRFSFRIIDIPVILFTPYAYLLAIDMDVNDCCSESATFSPEHKLSVIVLIVLNQLAVIVSVLKPKTLSPLIEVLINCILLLGLGFNVVLIFHVESLYFWVGILQIMIVIFFQLYGNHMRFIEDHKTSVHEYKGLQLMLYKILLADPFVKFPILLVLCLPVFVVLTMVLMLFGQKPDSIVRAFTDTYKHGLSELDYMCNDVQCETGHYLCTIAANGHADVVKPLRTGIRQGKTIVCNRQLLVSNAFEELIEEKFPKLHKWIRSQYNKVGKQLHQHYHVFNKQWVSDVVYILMKPLEWLFVLTLYTFDKKPENRIALQYTQLEQRNAIKKQL